MIFKLKLLPDAVTCSEIMDFVLMNFFQHAKILNINIQILIKHEP